MNDLNLIGIQGYKAKVGQAVAEFHLTSAFQPAGDQPQAIDSLYAGLIGGSRDQTLLGVTGSGKTFTIAHVIQKFQRPALILAPNKTLAAQLYGEMKDFFPRNAVEYFVSYYDYYQPEAYVPRSDTYIEKTATINEQIDRMRHAATRSLLERRDVIVVASVSCIYGIGSLETYGGMIIPVKAGEKKSRQELLRQLVELQYRRNDIEFVRGNFRVRGDNVDIFPAHYEDRAWRIVFFGDDIEAITEFDPLTGERMGVLPEIFIFANSHYVTPRPTLLQAMQKIKLELKSRLDELRAEDKLLEAQRLEQRTVFDLEMMESAGSCAGIENYSRYLSGRQAGEAPPTLFEYLSKDALLIVDESHVTLPQLQGMYKGDFARKKTLADYGFRLPSCLDNRPLKFEEWDQMRPQTIYVSATPGSMELTRSHGVFTEQIVRPTGLIDPVCEIRPTKYQIDDLLNECRAVIARAQRILITTLTKKMAESLTEYLLEAGLRVRYLHSDIETLERIEILRELRLGKFDVLVGINLLREGLDIPECALVAILDADKEGYLRSRTSLIQTIGRAARNIDGKAILYADQVTESMRAALDETARRREKQLAYNQQHGITPESIRKDIRQALQSVYDRADRVEIDTGDAAASNLAGKSLVQHLAALKQKMLTAAENLEFETAANLRDEIKRLEAGNLEIYTPPQPKAASPGRKKTRR